MGVERALDNHRHHHRHRAHPALVAGRGAVAVSIVLHVVLHGCQQVVRPVTADAPAETQFVREVILLDVAMHRKCNGSALREAPAEAPPVVLEVQSPSVVDVLLIELATVLNGIHNLPGRQLLRQVGMVPVLAHAIALVVGRDEHTMGNEVLVRVVSRSVCSLHQHAEQHAVLVVLVRGRALLVAGNRVVAVDVERLDAVGLDPVSGHPGDEQGGKHDVLAIRIRRRIVERVEQRVRALIDLLEVVRRLWHLRLRIADTKECD